MKRASWHTFQVLTKRAERLESLAAKLDWPPNVWMGVSVETPEYRYRIDHLRRTPAQIRFISFEPLLAALGEINFAGIHWAIVGGESGPKSRPMNAEWATEIRDRCLAARVPFFFKQWGGTNKKKAGRLLEGRLWDELPLARPCDSPGPKRASASFGLAPRSDVDVDKECVGATSSELLSET